MVATPVHSCALTDGDEDERGGAEGIRNGGTTLVIGSLAAAA